MSNDVQVASNWSAVFDQIRWVPLLNSTSYYFPLKRISQQSQFVLGRNFLRMAYLMVDYERESFSLSPSLAEVSKEVIVPILPLSAPKSSPSATIAKKARKKVSQAAWVGIGLGVGILLIIAAGLLITWRKRRVFIAKKEVPVEIQPYYKTALDVSSKPRAEAMGAERIELDTAERHEVQGLAVPKIRSLHELPPNHVERR